MRMIWICLCIVACMGTVFSVGMLISAIGFGEFGRVLFYGVIAIACIFSFCHGRKRKKH